jgi:hypothetical protein
MNVWPEFLHETGSGSQRYVPEKLGAATGCAFAYPENELAASTAIAETHKEFLNMLISFWLNSAW